MRPGKAAGTDPGACCRTRLPVPARRSPAGRGRFPGTLRPRDRTAPAPADRKGCRGCGSCSRGAGFSSARALDVCVSTPQNPGARRLDGRCCTTCDRGKSGLHGNTVPVNGRRGRPQGKCHRKQTACLRAQDRGSPAGKGETVRQERTAPLATGAAGQTPPGARPNRGGRRQGPGSWSAGTFPSRRPGWSREARSDARPRGMAVPCPFAPCGRARTEPGLQAVWQRLSRVSCRGCGPRSRGAARAADRNEQRTSPPYIVSRPFLRIVP